MFSDNDPAYGMHLASMEEEERLKLEETKIRYVYSCPHCRFLDSIKVQAGETINLISLCRACHKEVGIVKHI